MSGVRNWSFNTTGFWVLAMFLVACFVALRIAGVVGWSLWVVFAPLWAMALPITVLFFAVFAVVTATSNR